MSFKSILFPNHGYDKKADQKPDIPEFFHDLNLNQIIDSITFDKKEYNLKPFFYHYQLSIDEITYRQEVMADLEYPDIRMCFEHFACSMQKVHKQLLNLEKFQHKYQKERFFLDAVEEYCNSMKILSAELSDKLLRSNGLSDCRIFLGDYVQSVPFTLLANETQRIVKSLSSVHYCLLIDGLKVQVRKYKSEQNYTSEVEETFSRFRKGSVKDYRITFPDTLEMNHVEELILDGVAQTFPEFFLKLDDFFTNNQNFLDNNIIALEREIQFYLAYHNYISLFKKSGLPFCYPSISEKSKDIYSQNSFDLALALQLINENSNIVTNDFYLNEKERVLVVTGPNQGGKTTFARVFGQMHYLAGIGYPVPGTKAKLFHFDRLFTQFEREEEIKNLRGKLQDELIRIHKVLKQSTQNSIIVINEMFTSTSLQDQISLSKKIMKKILNLDLLCVWVTFIDELALFDEKTVSMVSSIVQDNPSLRTYKITRKPPDGLAYAQTIAEKHRMTYAHIMDRMRS